MEEAAVYRSFSTFISANGRYAVKDSTGSCEKV